MKMLLNTAFAASPETAKIRPPEKKQKKQPVKKSPAQKAQEAWRDAQYTMASECDNAIHFGEHTVDQQSVLKRLKLVGNSTVEQARPGPENSHVRIMFTSDGVCYWTNGLTHKEKRNTGQFTVYRRIGANKFEHVSGIRHKKDPN